MHSLFLRLQTVVENSRSRRKAAHKHIMNEIEDELGGSGEKTPLLSRSRGSVQNPSDEYMQQGSSTVIGVPSTVLEPPNVYRSRWRSIKVLYGTTFLSSMSFSVNAGSLWPYLQQMDPSANTVMLGLIVAIYSLGQLVASVLVGVWASKRGSHKEPIMLTLVLGLVGNLMYSYIEDVPAYRQYALMAARLVLGVYAANIAVIRSYTSGATTMKERTSAFALLSASQALGFVIGPALQTAFAPVDYPGPFSSVYLYVNMYTLPTLLMALLVLVNGAVLAVCFQEYTVNSEPLFKDGRSDSPLKPDHVAVACCLFMFFTILACFCLGETILSPLGIDMFGWSKQEATLYTGLSLLGQGAISIPVFLAVKPISKTISEKKLLILGHLSLLLGLFVSIPWGSEHPPIRILDLEYSHNSSSAAELLSMTVAPNVTEDRGCNSLQQAWCLTTPKLTLAQYFGTQLFVALGYPSAFVIINSMFSKILPPSPQGTMMGMLTSAGCLARLLGPGVVGTLYTEYGPWPTYTAGMCLILLSLLTYLACYKRIKPFSLPARSRSLYTTVDASSAAQRT